MKSVKLLIFVLSFLTFAIKSSAELEQAIVKTDMEAVKTLLANTQLDAKTRNRLLDLADNIILMRLKTYEIYSCKMVTQADTDYLAESLSKETIKEINDKHKLACWLEKKQNLWLLCCIGFFLLSGTSLDTWSINHDRTHLYLLLGGLAGAVLSFKKTINANTGFKNASNAEQSSLRSNLQKNYSNAILVKQLLLQALVI